MKKQYFPILLILLTVFLNSCGPSKQDAINWNDSIIDIENEVNTAVGKFTSAIDTDGADLNKELTTAIAVADKGIAKMKALEDFKDGAEFKSSGVEFLTLYLSIMKNEYKEIADLISNPNSSEADFEKVKEHAVNSDNKIEAANKKFISAQKDFAKKWGFELEK